MGYTEMKNAIAYEKYVLENNLNDKNWTKSDSQRVIKILEERVAEIDKIFECKEKLKHRREEERKEWC